MECVLSGNQIKTFNRAIVCLAKIGNEMLIEALPEKLTFRTLNSSRSSFLSMSFKAQFFDAYNLLDTALVQCMVLLKSVCTVFRTSPGSIDRLSVSLADRDAAKVQWTLECHNGMTKTYWISCNAEDDAQDVVVPRETLSTHLVVKPRDLNRLLSNFQSSLSEITLIATEPVSTPTDSETSETKAVELRSYYDSAKDSTEDALHTQLWIDPMEELQEYSHSGDAVDVTFSVKELKAFLVFCEGSEADMHMYFEKSGHPVLLAPRFGLDDAAHADFDATLVLATLQGSQIRPTDGPAYPQAAVSGSRQEPERTTSHGQRMNNQQRHIGSRSSTPGSVPDSDHTVIWSELTGSVGRTSRADMMQSAQLTSSQDASEEIAFRLHGQQRNPVFGNSTPTAIPLSPVAETTDLHRTAGDLPGRTGYEGRRETVPQRVSTASIPGVSSELPMRHTLPERVSAVQQAPSATTTREAARGEFQPTTQDHATIVAKNLSNWVSGDMEDDDEDSSGEDFCVQSTPPHQRGLY